MLFLLPDYDDNADSHAEVLKVVMMTNRSVGALWAPTSSWRPFGPLDVVLRALRPVRRARLRPGPPFFTILDHLRPFQTIKEHLDHFRPFWTILTVFHHFGPIGPF